MTSFKHPWDPVVATTSLTQTGMYEASANIVWINPFPVNETAQQIAGDPPQWKSILEAVDKFMTLDATENRSLAPTQGIGVARLLFPITVAARCDQAADGGTIRVLGHFDMVFGQLYVFAYYIGLFKAMQAGDLPLVGSLWQMGRTVTLHVRTGLSESQLAIWSIKGAEEAHHIDGVLGDSFSAFADKCLRILDMPRRHREANDDATAIGDDTMTSRKATTKLAELQVCFRGHKVNQTMAIAVLAFRNHITERSMKLLAEIEGKHGRDVLNASYTKILRIVSNCSEGNKVTCIAVGTLVEATLDAINYHLSQEDYNLKPADVSVGWLDGMSKPKGKQDATTGFVVKAIGRCAFMQHFEMEVKEFQAKTGNSAAAIVKDLKTLLEIGKTYSSFSKVLVPPQGTQIDDHLNQYKEKNMQTNLGKRAVELVNDILTGILDEKLAAHIQPDGQWTPRHVNDWRTLDSEVWNEIIKQMSTDSNELHEAASEHKSLSNASDDAQAQAEHAKKATEREIAWSKATELRRQFVHFDIPKAWKKKELNTVYESSKAHKWSEGRAGDSHRVFIFSADMVEEDTSIDGKPWVQSSAWTTAGDECVKFMQSKREASDLLVFFDGRSSDKCLLPLLKHHENNRFKAHSIITYSTTNRLGRRVAFGSDNVETCFLSLPAPRCQFQVKNRQDSCGCAAGETTTHDLTYSGVAPMSWAKMTLCSDEDKEGILGPSAGKSKPRKAVFDTSSGQPLFWAERKPIEFWQSLFRNLDAKVIIDCTPGSGTAARAALEMGIQYFGLARNERHSFFLCNVLNKQALRMMRTQGSLLFHQDMTECISAHFATDLAAMADRDTAGDTELDDSDAPVPIEDLCVV